MSVKKFPKFLTYVETTILNIVKEIFVRTWIYYVLHLDNLTTNKVEWIMESCRIFE